LKQSSRPCAAATSPPVSEQHFQEIPPAAKPLSLPAFQEVQSREIVANRDSFWSNRFSVATCLLDRQAYRSCKWASVLPLFLGERLAKVAYRAVRWETGSGLPNPWRRGCSLRVLPVSYPLADRNA
jgi:hypothetical protein